jgi:hypothetical protein
MGCALEFCILSMGVLLAECECECARGMMGGSWGVDSSTVDMCIAIVRVAVRRWAAGAFDQVGFGLVWFG